MVENWQEELSRGGTLIRPGLETVFGRGLGDREHALELLTSGKFAVGALARALTETSNPELRELLLTQLNVCVKEHFRLADLAVSKGWYQPYAAPEQQLAAAAVAARQVMTAGGRACSGS